MAAIATAQMRGAIVYATVSTEDKREFLVSELSMAREINFHSRDTSFIEDIFAAKKQRAWMSC